MEVVSLMHRGVLLCLKFIKYGEVSFAFTGNRTIEQVTLFFSAVRKYFYFPSTVNGKRVDLRGIAIHHSLKESS
jgi:hypothetical protein